MLHCAIEDLYHIAFSNLQFFMLVSCVFQSFFVEFQSYFSRDYSATAWIDWTGLHHDVQ